MIVVVVVVVVVAMIGAPADSRGSEPLCASAIKRKGDKMNEREEARSDHTAP